MKNVDGGPSDARTVELADGPSEVQIVKTDRLCSRIDAVRLAKAIGAKRLTPNTAGETLMTGGEGPASLECSLRERTDAYEGFDFGFTIEDATTLEEQDNRFEWEPYELMGKPARIGVAVDSLHVQVIVNGVRLHADLAHDTIDPLKLEKPLVAAVTYIVELLPADATALLRQ